MGLVQLSFRLEGNETFITFKEEKFSIVRIIL